MAGAASPAMGATVATRSAVEKCISIGADVFVSWSAVVSRDVTS